MISNKKQSNNNTLYYINIIMVEHLKLPFVIDINYQLSRYEFYNKFEK